MSNKKLKAYKWDDEIDGTTIIVWAETAGKAKAYIADENDVAFVNVKVYRVPWADEYGAMERIPPEVYLDNGWWLACSKCGDTVLEDSAVVVDGEVYCIECYKEMSKR